MDPFFSCEAPRPGAGTHSGDRLPARGISLPGPHQSGPQRHNDHRRVDIQWVLSQAAASFDAGRYDRILILRAADENERYVESSAACNDPAEILASYGVSKPRIGMLLYPKTERDRTYHAAIAARDWLIRHSTEKSFDVVTAGPHARRSRMMFKKAFGKDFEVGIIALNDPAYDPKHWWRTSEGVRDVVGEVIAYIYAEVRYTWM